MDGLIEARVAQAEEQLAFWQQQERHAARQVAMWEGALLALRGLQETPDVIPANGEVVEESE